MAYFSNGIEGMIYQEQWCNRCVHDDADGGCPVWNAHLDRNYDECSKPESILHMLIPRETTTVNGKCRMFIAKAASGDLFAAEGR